jgi:NADH-quinone oxidoreductase subunit M
MSSPLILISVFPFLIALALLLMPGDKNSKIISTIGAAIQLALVLFLLRDFMSLRASGVNEQFLFLYDYSWFANWNIHISLGIDGMAMTMLLMTAFVVLAGSLISWNMQKLPKEFFILLNLLSAGAYGFFSSLDLFTMFFFLELAVVPKFLLIGIWGSGEKEKSAFKLVLMLMAGSALILVGMLWLYLQNGHTFSIVEMASNPPSKEIQMLVFPLLFVGFGVFTALFPFHTWVPDGHSSAPTAGSMFLAGISMKLGAFGCLRVATYLLPEAAQSYSWIIVVLASIAIIYGAFATLMQTDLKYINAYSSISHCGFILLGIGMLTKTSITGAIMQMVSHGLMTALFFGAIGIIYSRTHTRKVEEMGGLLKSMPFISSIFIIAGLCSLGLPGLSGFAAEMTIFVGSWQHADIFHRISSVLAISSIVVTAVYILRAVGKVIMGPIKNVDYLKLEDANLTDKLATGLLTFTVLFMGLAPFWFIGLVSKDAQIIMDQFTHQIILP